MYNAAKGYMFLLIPAKSDSVMCMYTHMYGNVGTRDVNRVYERRFAEHKKPAVLTISALFPPRQKNHVYRREKSGGDQFSILRRGRGFRVLVV